MSETDLPDSPSPETGPYRVLARKYRPSSFDALIGQEALVRTLTNAINTGRLAQAWMLTGVRGVGKTTTARLIARALNCIGPDGTGGVTIDPCGVCDHCRAIAQDRHVDVLEMDAASRTGVGDIREILDGVRYRPSSARTKVYIIDEVHMLSTAAFNALLKTLEEPPEHVKFIFATTEIRKVPITVLSRCQRFDLRRVGVAELAAHFGRIAVKERATVDPGALSLISRAADGSVRDGLSLLDQAIAHGGGAVTEAQVVDMLGLADRAVVFDLLDNLLVGHTAEALALLERQYALGADPLVVLQDMLELVHWMTRVKVVPASADDAAVPEAERTRGKDMADRLSMAALNRAWQMLLKGLGESRDAPVPLQAVEMTLIRLAYAADLPTPEDALRHLTGKAAPAPRPPTGVGPGGGGAGGGGEPPSGGTAMANAVGQSASPSRGNGEHSGLAPPGMARPRLVPTPAPESPPRSVARPMMAPPPAEEPAPAFEPPISQAPPPRVPYRAPVALEDSRGAVGRVPATFKDLVGLCRDKREAVVAGHLFRDVQLVRYDPKGGLLEIHPLDGAPAKLAGQVGKLLADWTGRRWMVTVTDKPGQPTLHESTQADIHSHPLIRAVLEAFPGATVGTVRENPEARAALEEAEAQEVILDAAMDPTLEPGTLDPDDMDDPFSGDDET
ncbi:MAG: DNA polymerase III subunit gamma/tau [Rhodospirillum sp.]|nr:DNA polymerase III subunit gamma/tau [Rhodospirillum sp.]MCF8488921.1 DNA polymerase III subunit gamma/tau [Rhodospirillum sp.]MCF8498977.1 DNA polymerase III subunit gamma/tau [Rhodospirillum sp.]